MDLETLQKAGRQRAIVAEIRAEIRAAAIAYKSPPIITSGRGRSYNSQPTQTAAFKRIELEERLARETEVLLDLLEPIEQWLAEECDDPEVEAAIRWRYLIGTDWATTTEKIYGKEGYHKNYDRARKQIYRYFEKESEKRDR